ncbi:GH19347 [Drosophila grimshawi]|uniref:GH19347 n=2 Tax=Drosophila grimshawi TaxID=7222 RepID=B4JFM5_DROGR|nr:GH19347 [Drosophila grimshawi]
MKQFLREIPKVELHAHLNGSLNIESIKQLAEELYGEQTKEFAALCKRFIKFEEGAKMNDCFEKFGFVHELTATKRGLQRATELVIRDFAADNVIYVELRTTPKSNEKMSRRDYLQTVIDAIKSASKQYKIMVKLLPSINRGEPLAVAEETVALAVEFAQTEPDLIVGIDFSGNPNLGKFSDFTAVLSLARNNGLQLAVHCGEVDNPREIQEMLKFGMSRCGHGTYLTEADYAQLKEKNIPIECCLTSNVKSGTVANFNDHHFRQLMAADVPRVICTDDCGVFDTTLSDEFHWAMESFGLSRSQCVDLTVEAMKHSFATPQEKRIMQLLITERAK